MNNNLMQDYTDIETLEDMTQDYQNVVRDLVEAIGYEADLKSQLQIATARVRALQEQNKLIQEQIRVQKKKIDVLPK